MRIELLQRPAAVVMAQELERFEREFTYPLGAGRRFHISHQGDPWRFFQAMGSAAYALAIHDGRILGVLGATQCRICAPVGQDQTVLYLGDLKVTPSARGGPILLSLIRAITSWSADRATAAYAVVMDGTEVTPDRYSGRLGIPQLSAQATQTLLWLSTGSAPTSDPDASISRDACRLVDAATGEAAFTRLARGRFRGFSGTDARRSRMTQQWLLGGQGSCSGRLEDTLLAKRLYADDGTEMISAHLAYVASRDLHGILELLACACSLAAQAGYPMLFVALEPQVAAAVAQRLGACVRSLAPVTIYTCGLETSTPWHLNSSDI